MGIIKERRLSVNYYRILPEGAPYQLIEGELVMTPAPNPRHQIILGRLFMILYNFVEQRKMGIVLISPVDLYLDDENAFQPDIIFISNEGQAVIKNDGIYGPPDLVMEVISPSTAHYDLKEKFRVYERTGVKEYWIVDPEMNSIEIYISKDKRLSLFARVEERGEIESPLLKDMKLNLENVFRAF